MRNGELVELLVALGAAHGREARDVGPDGLRFDEVPDGGAGGSGPVAGWEPALDVELARDEDDGVRVTVGAVTLEVPRADTLAVADAILTGGCVRRAAPPAPRGGLRGVLDVFRRALGTSIVVEISGGRRYSAGIPFWAWDSARAVGTVPAAAAPRDPFTAWVEALPEAPAP